ncbi:hypothetical protein ES703_18849 [subsurface metagenome]
MSTKTQNLIVTLSIFLLLVVLGCASFQAALTPCYVSPAAAKWANTKTTSLFPWTTLFDAQRVEMKLDYVYTMKQITDTLDYEYHKGITRFHKAAGEELRAALFDPTGPLGMLIPASLSGTACALLFSKPSDKKKIKELEANVS